VHWVVTEYGAVNLHGRSIRERAEALISIAHPDFRAGLTKDLQRLRPTVTA
jgi:acyl-CoA hydrolase